MGQGAAGQYFGAADLGSCKRYDGLSKRVDDAAWEPRHLKLRRSRTKEFVLATSEEAGLDVNWVRAEVDAPRATRKATS